MDKSTGSKPNPRRRSPAGRIVQRSGFTTIRRLTGLQGFGRCKTVLQNRFDLSFEAKSGLRSCNALETSVGAVPPDTGSVVADFLHSCPHLRLPCTEQSVVDMDIDFRDLDFPGWTRRLKQGLFQNLKSNSASPFNQLLQCLSDSLLPLLRCQL